MAATVVFESRLSGSDGAYTDQKVVLVDAMTANGWFEIEHDLGRIPDWVRVTKLTHGILDPSGPAQPDAAHLEPALDVAATLAPPHRLVWDAGIIGGGPNGRPILVIDLTEALWFGAEGDQAYDVYFLVEFGITHSVGK